MRKGLIIRIAAVVVIVGSLASIFLSLNGLPPSTDSQIHRAAGRALAKEVLSRLREDGQVLVITRDTVNFKQPAAEMLLDSLESELRDAHAKIRMTRTIAVDPLRLMEVPSGDFMEMIRAAPSGSVVVSLLGPPMLTEPQRSALGEVKAKIVAFCPGGIPAQVDLRLVFAQHLLDAAIVSRRIPSPASSKNPQGEFERFFRVVTAANVGSLYASAAALP